MSTATPRRRGMVRNFMHLGLGQVVTTVLTIMLTWLTAKMLDLPELGLLFLIYSISTFTFVVIDWGHGTLLIREASRHHERTGELFGTTLALRTAGCLVACPIVLAVTWGLGYDLLTKVMAIVVILVSLPQYLGLSFGWVFRAWEWMDRDALINVVFKLSNLLLAGACLLLGGRVLSLVLAAGVAGCVTLLLAATMYRKMQLPRLSVKRSTALELLHDGTPIFAMTMAIAVVPVFNANILYKMASPEMAGWFGSAWTIAGTLIAPATVLATAVYPRLSPAADDPVEFKRIVNVSFRPIFLLAVLGAVGTWLFAEVPVALILGLPKFAASADIVRAFAPLLLLMYVSLFLSTAALALGRASRLAISKVAAVVLSVGLSFLLVPLFQERYGNAGLGVMYAMVAGEFVVVCVSWVLVRAAIDGRTVSDMLRGLVAGAATMGLFKVLPALTPFLAIPLCVLAFGAVALLVGAIHRSDVDMLLASFRKRPQPQ